MKTEQLNNTCILFDKDNEAQQKAIIKFYNDNGYSLAPKFEKWNNEKYIGVKKGQLNYWWNDPEIMRIIDLPKEYYPIDTPIVETSLCVIEEVEISGVEWGLSFDGSNPNEEDYFQMIDKETAFRLKDKLAHLFPPTRK